MINIKPKILDCLEAVFPNVDISDSYPEDFEKQTQITYTEEQNKAHDMSGNKVITSYVRYRIDIWDKESASDIACIIDKELNEKIGLVRTDCMDNNEIGRRHKIMRFEGVLEEDGQIMFSVKK